MARAGAVAARGARRRAARADQGRPRQKPPHLRLAARPRRVARAGHALLPQARRPPDARGGPQRPAPATGGAHDRLAARAARRPEPARARLHGPRARPALGGRHHLRADRRRLALPGRDPRPLLAPRRRARLPRRRSPRPSSPRRSRWRAGAGGRAQTSSITATAALSTRAPSTGGGSHRRARNVACRGAATVMITPWSRASSGRSRPS